MWSQKVSRGLRGVSGGLNEFQEFSGISRGSPEGVSVSFQRVSEALRGILGVARDHRGSQWLSKSSRRFHRGSKGVSE